MSDNIQQYKPNPKSEMFIRGYENTIQFAYIPDFKTEQEKKDFEAGLKFGYGKRS